ncbi:hypothetical protein ColTof4_03498 [Colletotrichum tofieldiae]|nr:hypothetical protein ColTof3_13075 [Colletotrichum tofieldiae]GKT71075.1 hypothetical protein ColTof4_03498 [Colletotrichum tofieldiae]
MTTGDALDPIDSFGDADYTSDLALSDWLPDMTTRPAARLMLIRVTLMEFANKTRVYHPSPSDVSFKDHPNGRKELKPADIA